MDLFIEYLTLILVVGLLFFQGLFVEKFSNNGIIYGIRVPEEYKNLEEINYIKKRYRKRYLFTMIILCSILFSIIYIYDKAFLLCLGIIIFLATNYTIYYFSWKEMKELKRKFDFNSSGNNILVVDMNIKNKDMKTNEPLSIKYYWIYGIIILITLLLTLVFYKDLPDTFATHFNGKGIADGFAVKGTLNGYLGVLSLPLTQIGMTIMFIFLHRYTISSKKIINSGTAKGTLEQQNKFRRYVGLFLYVMGLETIIMFFAMQIAILKGLEIKLIVGVFGVLTSLIGIIGVGILIYIGQGGKNIKVKDEGEIIYRDDDRFYKIGLFYYNKQDPAIMIQKRVGIGYDLNYGNPISKILAIVVGIILIGTVVCLFINDQSIIESFMN
ncbi:MAG: DUF1648 domain-containing protein [Clostridium sp.]|uniref:DUF1648 domain-containing protein n=1 Tax=Clostridium paraputrificum TaxID=29363 RepID=A0A6N3FMM7_9CLOT|nr:DUF1648 domain-containing protein [Clostridium sp.]MBS5925793.1 DUF1648 domain-containing protein [Clostridium sp.]MBS5985877.1 DUF1648 domain-containing protein [Clostridium sp.]